MGILLLFEWKGPFIRYFLYTETDVELQRITPFYCIRCQMIRNNKAYYNITLLRCDSEFP